MTTETEIKTVHWSYRAGLVQAEWLKAKKELGENDCAANAATLLMRKLCEELGIFDGRVVKLESLAGEIAKLAQTEPL